MSNICLLSIPGSVPPTSPAVHLILAAILYRLLLSSPHSTDAEAET